MAELGFKPRLVGASGHALSYITFLIKSNMGGSLIRCELRKYRELEQVMQFGKVWEGI